MGGNSNAAALDAVCSAHDIGTPYNKPKGSGMSITPQTHSPAHIPTVYVESSGGVIQHISVTGPVRVVVMDYDDPQLFPSEWETDYPNPENSAHLEQLIMDRDTPPSDRTLEQIARLLNHEGVNALH